MLSECTPELVEIERLPLAQVWAAEGEILPGANFIYSFEWWCVALTDVA